MTPSIDDISSDEAAELPADLRELRDAVARPEEGFFGPDSYYWRIGRENVLFLGGPAAVLLQLAHPQVAAGVSDHSSFDHDPVGRFNRTFQIVHGIIFGDCEQALAAAQQVRKVHTYVRGQLPEAVGHYEAGESYAANRPDLLLWVHATLVEQTLRGYELFVRRLTEQERTGFYEQSKRFAQLFGVPAAHLPSDLDAFYQYYNQMLDDTIAVGAQGDALRRQLLSGAIKIPATFFAAAMMPEPARRAFGLPWGRTRDRVFRAIQPAIRGANRLMPPPLRYIRMYRQRMRELGRP